MITHHWFGIQIDDFRMIIHCAAEKSFSNLIQAHVQQQQQRIYTITKKIHRQNSHRLETTYG